VLNFHESVGGWKLSASTADAAHMALALRTGVKMSSNSEKLIAVIGATGKQGGSVVRALKAGRQFKVRALSRNPGKHRELADEVVEADLDRPDTLTAAFVAAHGVFLVTNFWEQGADEGKTP
jgi:hypothetical protein